MRLMALLVMAIMSLLVLSKEVTLVRGDIATAASYGPPYTPTKCDGNNQDQFPSNSMFAAVSTSLWDNGAACGRKYIVKCLSGTGNRPCKQGNIVVQVVDKCPQDPCRATLLLSRDAFNALSRSPLPSSTSNMPRYERVQPNVVTLLLSSLLIFIEWY